MEVTGAKLGTVSCMAWSWTPEQIYIQKSWNEVGCVFTLMKGSYETTGKLSQFTMYSTRKRG